MKTIKRSLVVCLLIWSFLTYSASLSAQITLIPDSYFESYLLNLGIDSDGSINGQVLTNDITSVTHLTITAPAPIADFTGLEDFTSLTYLKVQGNAPLASINLSQNTNLDTLIFQSMNSLTVLNTSALINLKYLEYSTGVLTTLTLPTTIANLESINVNDNNLVAFPSLVGAAALTKLECVYNNLTTLDATGSTSLVELVAYGNLLQQVDVTGNPQLEKLHLTYNNLTTIDVSQNAVLDMLSIGENQLSVLDISQNTALVTLHAENNQLTAMDFSNNLLLKYLAVPDNQLITLDISMCDFLIQCVASSNPLQQVALNGPALKELYLSNLNSNLSYLDVRGNTGLESFRVTHTQLTELDLTNSPNLLVINANNNQLNSLRLFSYNMTSIIANHNPYRLWVCFLQDYPNLPPTFTIRLDPSAITSQGCTGYLVTGTVALDVNNNCLVDTTEQGLKDWWVQFQQGSNPPMIGTSDANGVYAFYLDTGQYTASIVANNPYQQACISTQTVTVDTVASNNILDWSVQTTIYCPYLTVDLSSPFLRTATTSSYYIEYCNLGTLLADSAYVEIDLDTALTYVTATIPLSSQVGSVLRFNLDTIAVGACGYFEIVVQLDTHVVIEQTHCTKAHIYPDTSCVPIWSDAVLQASARCLGSSIHFSVLNTGAAMTQPTNYFVFEDNIMMRQGTLQLGNRATQSIIQTASPGKTYRLSVEQLPGFPIFLGDPLTTTVVEGCLPFLGGGFNTGFVTQFSNGNSAPHIAVDCQQNVAAYDPNDKAAQPAGYGTPHYVTKNTALDYKIRFQNTGNDTAFNITILDTISSLLDLPTLQMGASSHPYTWTIQSNNVLRVHFYNIMLPDSNANEPLSNGFFRYRIEQQANNPLGSVINNQAAIYFDYNPPIFTNTTFHTVGENFVPIQLINTQVLDNRVEVLVYPNPLEQFTVLEIQGRTYENLHVSVYDAAGRVVAQISGQGNQVQLKRGNLSAGLYFYQLQGDGQRLATGKLMVR